MREAGEFQTGGRKGKRTSGKGERQQKELVANQYTRSNETNEKYPFTNDKNKNDEEEIDMKQLLHDGLLIVSHSFSFL